MPLLKRRIQFWAAGACGQALVSCIAASWRYRTALPSVNEDNLRVRGDQAIFVFWHRHLLSLLGRFRGYPVCVPVSESNDGEYVARVMERYGLLAVRGSSSRGQIKLIRGLLKAIDDGRSCAISPDGPRGPCYSVQPGFILLARRTGLPVFPLGVSVDRAWELHSWDSFVIPRPFSRIGIHSGPPVTAAEVEQQPIEVSCDQIGENLMKATRNAKTLLDDS